MPTASASDVVTSLENLINSSLGSSENAATKTRIHAVASILGSLGDELEPLLERTFDTGTLLGAIQQIENGLQETEEGVRSLMGALHKKQANDEPQENAVGVAA